MKLAAALGAALAAPWKLFARDKPDPVRHMPLGDAHTPGYDCDIVRLGNDGVIYLESRMRLTCREPDLQAKVTFPTGEEYTIAGPKDEVNRVLTRNGFDHV